MNEKKYPPELLEMLAERGVDPDRVWVDQEFADLLHDAFQRGMLVGVARGRLSEEQYAKFEAWRKQQDAAVAAEQGNKLPYYGAIGGAYVFTTCATSLGVVNKVRNDLTGATIDLTDYADW